MSDKQTENVSVETSENVLERPEWQDALPDCLCEEDDIKKEEGFEKRNEGLQTFHPGAANGYRSTEPVEFESPDGEKMYPGQQCTYDEHGDLITHGPGAGTPDKVSPNHSKGSHFIEDVVPWYAKGQENYNKEWQPNNDLDCKENPPAEKTESAAEPPIVETQNAEDALESFINEKESADSELESILAEPPAVESGTEFLPETQPIESEMSSQSEM